MILFSSLIKKLFIFIQNSGCYATALEKLFSKYQSSLKHAVNRQLYFRISELVVSFREKII